MRLLLVRHADAVPEGPWLPDDHRYLSVEGRGQARQLGRLLRGAGLQLGLVVSSPLVRAVQTAELVASVMEFSGPIETSPRLAPGGPSPTAVRWLGRLAAELPGGMVAAAFGHEPSISGIAEVLSGVEPIAAFRKAEACLVEGGQMIRRLSPHD